MREYTYEQLKRIFYKDFQYVMQYRRCKAPDFDTYVSFIYDKKIIIFQLNDKQLVLIDCLKLKSSSIFQDILSYCDEVDLLR